MSYAITNAIIQSLLFFKSKNMFGYVRLIYKNDNSWQKKQNFQSIGLLILKLNKKSLIRHIFVSYEMC